MCLVPSLVVDIFRCLAYFEDITNHLQAESHLHGYGHKVWLLPIHLAPIYFIIAKDIDVCQMKYRNFIIMHINGHAKFFSKIIVAKVITLCPFGVTGHGTDCPAPGSVISRPTLTNELAMSLCFATRLAINKTWHQGTKQDVYFATMPLLFSRQYFFHGPIFSVLYSTVIRWPLGFLTLSKENVQYNILKCYLRMGMGYYGIWRPSGSWFTVQAITIFRLFKWLKSSITFNILISWIAVELFPVYNGAKCCLLSRQLFMLFMLTCLYKKPLSFELQVFQVLCNY